MSFVDAIQERHAFEDRVKKFLALASVMTDRELELALGRLADMLDADAGPEHVQVRGDLLKTYYDLRLQKIKKHRSFKRLLHWGSKLDEELGGRKGTETDSDYMVRTVTTFVLLANKAIGTPAAMAQVPLIDTVKSLAP